MQFDNDDLKIVRRLLWESNDDSESGIFFQFGAFQK